MLRFAIVNIRSYKYYLKNLVGGCVRNFPHINISIFLSLILAILSGCRGTTSAPQVLAEKEKLAQIGNSDAQFEVGRLYFIGYAGTKDKQTACKWFEKSAAQGNSGAQFYLYYCVIDSDPVQAKKILLNSALQGQSNAISELSDSLGKFQKSLSNEQIKVLARNNISNESELKDLIQKMQLNSFYAKNFGKYELRDVIFYLTQNEEAEKNKISFNKQLENYKAQRLAKEAEIAKLLRQQQEAAEKASAEFAKEYPYEAVISCDFSGGHTMTITCFTGGGTNYRSRPPTTELEVQNGQDYKMYKAQDVMRAGKENAEGLIIPLRQNYKITAQNASDFALLTVKIRDTKTKKVTFIKSVAEYGVVKVGN
jgi:TPR repeat protein